ncbi:hypothetical protein CWO17_20975 [Vibrio sp. 10N.286.45.A3]|nr:hypothetical protein BTO12_19500 [Vibrio splendidus]PTO98063.1 hypothetical protein CWO17_20975 [Vibrio sp. 10N.286.45.A3]CAK2893506.1 hypothetical protein VCRA2133E348_340045 [Vibrio crassostreae]
MTLSTLAAKFSASLHLSQQSPSDKAIKNIPSFDPILTASIVSEVSSGEKISEWSAVFGMF